MKTTLMYITNEMKKCGKLIPNILQQWSKWTTATHITVDECQKQNSERKRVTGKHIQCDTIYVKWKYVINNNYKWYKASWTFWGRTAYGNQGRHHREVSFELDFQQQKQFLERNKEDQIYVNAVQAEKQCEQWYGVSSILQKTM